MANIGIFSSIPEPTRMLFKLVDRKYRILYSFFGQDANLVILCVYYILGNPKWPTEATFSVFLPFPCVL